MARGGKQPGAGRPKGATTRPQLRDFFTQEEIIKFVEDLKEDCKTDSSLRKFVAEQIFGKAVQPIGNDDDKPFKIEGVEITIRK